MAPGGTSDAAPGRAPSKGRRWREAVAIFGLAAAAVLVVATFASSAQAGACAGADTLPTVGSTKAAARAATCLINKRRHHHHLRRLRTNKQLKKAARHHSSYMDQHSCFSHQCPGEPDLLHRLRQAGYIKPGLSKWSYGEDIAWGAATLGTPKEIVQAWMQSPEHRANILRRSFRDIGLGVSWGTPLTPTGVGGIYTADFGSRRG